MNEGVLLDTCAVVWMANRQPMSQAALDVVSTKGGRLSVSAMSAWEIGMLITRGRLPTTKYGLLWFQDFVTASNAAVIAATPAVLIAAAYLPEPLHRDPMDRIIIATAREHDLTIITRDRAILAYAPPVTSEHSPVSLLVWSL